MQRITIDLVKEPEIKDLIANMQPGDLVDLHCSIQAMDDQTLTLTIDEAEEGQEPDKLNDGDGGTEADAEADPDQRSDQPTPDTGAADLAGGEQAAT